MTQTKLDRPIPITPLQQPTIPNVHQPKLQPPTNTNKPTISLLSGFIELQWTISGYGMANKGTRCVVVVGLW